MQSFLPLLSKQALLHDRELAWQNVYPPKDEENKCLPIKIRPGGYVPHLMAGCGEYQAVRPGFRVPMQFNPPEAGRQRLVAP